MSSRACNKRKFSSEEHARAAHSKAHFRVRPYFCPHCANWHVANAEKNADDFGVQKNKRHERFVDRPSWSRPKVTDPEVVRRLFAKVKEDEAGGEGKGGESGRES